MDIALASSAAHRDSDTDLEHLLQAATSLGYRAEVLTWGGPQADWSAFDRVVIRSCWDYTTRRAEFLAWCHAMGEKLVNAPGVIEWNSDKRYLQDLLDAGIAVVPTLWNVTSRAELGDGDSWVVKPTVSAGAANTAHWTDAAAAVRHAQKLLAAGHYTMTQPYVKSIDTVGEFANFFFAGRYSHTIGKPALLTADQTPGTDPSYPEGLTVSSADAVLLEFCERVVAAAEQITGHALVQARVDVVLDDAGAPMLMELEVVEPSLFLAFVPTAAEGFIRAVVGTGRSD